MQQQSIKCGVASRDWQDFWAEHHGPKQEIASLQDCLGYHFSDLTLLYQAITHRSAVADFQTAVPGAAIEGVRWNERLEFLGDSVLGLVITTALWKKHPTCEEGELSRARSSLVNETVLADIARSVRLGSSLALGRGEERNRGRDRNALLADALEAVFGAIYLDGGFEAATAVVLGAFSGYLSQDWRANAPDYKTKLQELVQGGTNVTPTYRLIREIGPDHAKEFEMVVCLGDEPIGHGRGSNKKQASQEAARAALEKMLPEERIMP